MATPLHWNFNRRRVLVGLNALAPLMQGLTAEQLRSTYRTQFALLRKHENEIAFDAESLKLCGYNQSTAYRHPELQDQAKASDLPAEWKNLWKLYKQYEEDPTSVDWLGYYTPPFTRDREAEMTNAHNEFKRRPKSGEYK